MPAPYTAFTYGLTFFTPTPLLQAFGPLTVAYPWWMQFTFSAGTQGIPYAEQFTPGATFPLSVTLQSGTLPPGLSLSSVNGPALGNLFQIAGTPSAVGTYTFTLRATNTSSLFTDQSFTIRIYSAATAGGGTAVTFAA